MDGVWTVKYPWKRDPKFTVLRSTEKRLLQNSVCGELYKDQMQDMITHGVARQLTEDELTSYTYVDYIIDSLDSKEESRKVSEEIHKILGTGNMEIKEWHMLSDAKESGISFTFNSSQKVLGMFWDIHVDVF